MSVCLSVCLSVCQPCYVLFLSLSALQTSILEMPTTVDSELSSLQSAIAATTADINKVGESGNVAEDIDDIHRQIEGNGQTIV